MTYDIAIIGGGPGGYTAAEHAAKLGKSVVLFEKDLLGGTCLNRGCMPTKSLLHGAETYVAMRHASDLGLVAENVGYDFSAMHRRKTEVIDALRQGVEKLMKAGKIAVVRGKARVEGEGRISCGGEIYEATDIILATGTKVFCPPIPGWDNAGVVTSDDLLEGEGRAFSSLVIIGAGVVGVECACLYLALGADVTLIEAADHILPAMDRELAQRLAMMLKKQGCKVEAKATVQSIAGAPGAMTVTYHDKKGGEHTATGEGVLLAAGRKADLDGLFAPGAEPELERGAIVADEVGRTSIPHLYAIGDVRARNIQLAHVAEAQGKNAVEVIAGNEAPIDMHVVPSCVYTTPEIASVGLTEDQAKAQGLKVKTGKYLTGANGKCLIEGTESGYVKLVADAETGRLLGAQMVCPRATDMIGELGLAVQRGVTADQLAHVIHPHPTFCEMISGAAETL